MDKLKSLKELQGVRSGESSALAADNGLYYTDYIVEDNNNKTIEPSKNNPYGPQLTAQQEQYLKAWCAGMTINQIAKEFKRSRTWISRSLRRGMDKLRLPPAYNRDEVINQLEKLGYQCVRKKRVYSFKLVGGAQ